MKKGFVILLLNVLLLAVVSAADTEINVKTLPDHDVSIYVLDASQVYYLLQSYHLATDWKGFQSVVYSGSTPDINVRVVVKKDNQQVLSEKFGPYKTGSPIYIQAIPGNLSKDYREFEKAAAQSTAINSTNITNVSSVNQNNDTISNSTNITFNENKTSEKNNLLGGFSLLKTNEKIISSLKYVGYGTIAIIVILLIILIVKKYGSSFVRYLGSIRPPHLKKSISSSSNIEIELRKAEKKLEEAQKQIERIKREERIKEVKKRLQEDLEELKRLQRGK